MTNQVQKMSASYKAIFIFSIFMVFFVLIAGAATQSKSSGIGIWIWGYTAWLMYKRRNSDLASFYKIILWFDIIAFCVVISVIAFSDNDVSRYIEYSLGEAFFLFTILISITYGLFKYFTNLSISGDDSFKSIVSDEGILWEQVSEEIKKGERVDSLWARAFSDADGDLNKANARYIKLRFEQLAQSIENYSNESIESIVQTNGTVITKRNNFIKLFTVSLISVFIIFITYQFLSSFLIKKSPVISYVGINLNSTMDEVQYILGFPSNVFDVDPIKHADGSIWRSFIQANKEEISSKGIKNFFYWHYDFPDYYISVGFDPNHKKVISIGCYVSDISIAIPKECEILKLNVKEEESVIKDRLGKPSEEKLTDITKTLYYKDLNLNLRFIKKRLYNIIVGTEDIYSVIEKHNQRINNDVDYCIEAKINARGKFDDLALKHGALNVKTKQEVLAEARLTCLSNSRK